MHLAALRPNWPLVTLFASGALLAGAHAFETFGGLRPCHLCLQQREFHWGVVGVSAAAFLITRFKPDWARWTTLLIGLALLGATYMAAYHVGVEQHWIIAKCDLASPGDITAFRMDGPIDAPSCDTPQWSMLGITMAGYNAIISLVLALATFAVALAKNRSA